MKLALKLLCIINLIGNVCYADDVTYLNQNDKAPYNGYLFTEDKIKEIRLKLIDNDTLTGLNESLTKTNSLLQTNSDLKDQQIKIMMDRNDDLAKSLRDSESTSNWERIIYFGLGVLATSVAIYGVKKVTQ